MEPLVGSEGAIKPNERFQEMTLVAASDHKNENERSLEVWSLKEAQVHDADLISACGKQLEPPLAEPTQRAAQAEILAVTLHAG